jgi:hypothetical protein
MRLRETAEIAEHADNFAEKYLTLRSLRALRFMLVFSVLCVSPVFAQQTHLLVITGVPGDEEHEKKFQTWAATFIDAAK